MSIEKLRETQPPSMGKEIWDRMLWHYPDTMQRIYNIATSSAFIYGGKTNYRGKTKYDAINEQIKTVVVMLNYREHLAIWRDYLIYTYTPVKETLEVAPLFNITRNLVVCKNA